MTRRELLKKAGGAAGLVVSARLITANAQDGIVGSDGYIFITRMAANRYDQATLQSYLHAELLALMRTVEYTHNKKIRRIKLLNGWEPVPSRDEFAFRIMFEYGTPTPETTEQFNYAYKRLAVRLLTDGVIKLPPGYGIVD